MSDKAMVHSGASASIPVEGGAGESAHIGLFATLGLAIVLGGLAVIVLLGAWAVVGLLAYGFTGYAIPHPSPRVMALAFSAGFTVMACCGLYWLAYDVARAILKALEAKQ